MSSESEPSAHIDGWLWRHDDHGHYSQKWHEGKPSSYNGVSRVRIRIDIPGKPSRWMQLRNPPVRGKTAKESSEWIETILVPRLWDAYLTSNG